MKITKYLYITPGCFDKGGISRYSRYQITAIREIFDYNQVSVFSLLGKDDYSFEEDFEVEYSANGNSFIKKSIFILKILKFIIKNRPSIVHFAHVNLSSIITYFSHIYNFQIIINAYGHEIWSNKSLINNYGINNCDYIISDCHHTASYIEENFPYLKASISVIWDCVDLKRFLPGKKSVKILSSYGLPNLKNKFIILTLGRLSFSAYHKGYHRLLKVFQILREEHDNVCLIFAGEGDMVNELKSEVEKHSLSEEVYFTGSIEEKDLPEIYKSANLFSLVSEIGMNKGEGLPLTPLESMACGVPIIVGDQDGSRELIIDDLNGFSINSHDLKDHTRKINLFINNSVDNLKYAKGAREIAQKYFSFEIFLDKHKKFFSILSDER